MHNKKMQGNKSSNPKHESNNNARNYLKPLKRSEDNEPQNKLREKEDLHALLHKLKNYYNELNKLKVSKSITLEELKKRNADLNKQIEDKEAFTDIDFPYQRISINDYEKFKDSQESKELIKSKIENLLAEKNDLVLKYQNEIEYGNKINNLINVEKRNMEDIHEHILQTKEKLKTVQKAQENLEINKDEKSKKEQIYKKVDEDLKIELIKLKDVTDFQTKKYSNLINELKQKNEFNQKFSREIELKDYSLDNQHKKNSDKILSEIQKTKMLKLQNQEKESYVIKLILGLDLIKRYFIDVDRQGREIDTAELIKSDDYKIFISDKFAIKENVERTSSQNVFIKSNSINNNSPKTNRTPESVNNNNGNFQFLSKNSTLNANIINEEDDKNLSQAARGKISLSVLKEKLENLDLDYEKIFNFYTKIMNKTNFYHNHMINFNQKQISLESQKELYTKRVKEIISKNSRNIEDFEKLNGKFAHLIQVFKEEIKANPLYDDLKNKIKDLDCNPNQHAEFYKKCRKYLSDVKTFNEFLNFNFKRIILDCPNESFKKSLSEKRKKMKENMNKEKNISSIDKTEYLRDMFQIIELEYLKENKKYEKIMRAIEDLNSLGDINNNSQLNKENNKRNSKDNLDDPEECMDNEDNENKNNKTIYYLKTINTKGEEVKKIKEISLNKEALEINFNPNQATNYNNKFPSFNSHQQNDNLTNKPSSLMTHSDNMKSQTSGNNNILIDELAGGFPYITPYSGWSLELLLEEKEATLKKIINYKEQLEVGKYLEDSFNLKNFTLLGIPFEKTLFYFFENAESIIENITLAKHCIEDCSRMNIEEKPQLKVNIKASNSPGDLGTNKAIQSNNYTDKIKSPSEFRKTGLQKENNSIFNYMNILNQLKQVNEVADYDSYSSEEDQMKGKKKNSTVHISSNLIKSSLNKTSNRNRSSAPILSIKQQEKNQRIYEKLYMPFIKDKTYKLEVNSNLSKIKEDSKTSSMFSHKLLKRKEEVDKLGKQLFIYNNPYINIDKISNITYNSIVKHVINNHMQNYNM